MSKNLFTKPVFEEDEQAQAKTREVVTDEDRADPIAEGLTDEEIIAAKRPASNNAFSQPVYEDEPPPPPAAPEPRGFFKSSVLDQLVGGYYDFRGRESAFGAIEAADKVRAASRGEEVIDKRRRGYIKGEPVFFDEITGRPTNSMVTGDRKSASTPEQRQKYIEKQTNEIVRLIGKANEFTAKGQEIPLSPETMEFLDKNSDKTVWEAFKAAPAKIIVELGARSGMSMVPSIGSGVAGGVAGSLAGPGGTAAGFAVGMGAGSARVEYVASVVDGLRERGVDLSNPEAIAKAVTDEKMMQEVQKQATIRAAAIGGMDAIAGLVGAKNLTPAIRGRLMRELVNTGVQMPTQGALGAGGEALAQVGSGQELNTRDIAAEAAGEFVTAPVDIAAATMSGARGSGAKPEQPSVMSAIEEAQARARKEAAARGGDALDQEVAAATAGAEIGSEHDLAAETQLRRMREQQAAVDAQAARLDPEQRAASPLVDAILQDDAAVSGGTVAEPITTETAAPPAAAPGPASPMRQAQARVDAEAARQQEIERYAPTQAADDAARARIQEEAAGRYEAEIARRTREAEQGAPPPVTAAFEQREAQDAAQRGTEEETAYNQRQAVDRVSGVRQATQAQEIAQAAPTLADVAPPAVRTLAERRAMEATKAKPGSAASEISQGVKTPKVGKGVLTPSEAVKTPKPTLRIPETVKRADTLKLKKEGGAWKIKAGVETLADYGTNLTGARTALNEARRDVAARIEAQKPRVPAPNLKGSVAPADSKGSVDAPTVAQIDEAAHQAATSPQNDLPEPSDAQIEAGNYKKGHVQVQGLNISIENPRGSTRGYTAPDGSKGSRTMRDNYGYIKRTEGADGDHVDAFIGENPESDRVFVIDQVKPNGSFDEHKVMVGYPSQLAAVRSYKRNYQKNWKVGPVTEMSVGEFKTWLKEGDTTKPLKPKELALPATEEQVQEAASAEQRRGRKTKVRYREGDAAVAERPKQTDEKEFENAIEKPGDVKAPLFDTPQYEEESPTGNKFSDARKYLDESISELTADLPKTSDRLRVRRDLAKLRAIKQEMEGIEGDVSDERVRDFYRDIADVTGLDVAPLSLTGKETKEDRRQKGLSLEKANKALEVILKELPGINPVVVRNPLEAPESIFRQVLEDGMPDARGLYDEESDSVYVFAENHSNTDDLLKTVIHEGVAHKGLRHLLGAKFEPTMREIFDVTKDRAWIDDFIAQHDMNPNNDFDKVVAAEEYAASLSERGDAAGLLKKLIAAIRAVLRKIGIVKEWSDNDIHALLRKSRTGLQDKASTLRERAGNSGLLYAAQKPSDPRLNKQPEHPLAVGYKIAATMETQADYNPGVVRSRLDAAKDFGQNNINLMLALIPRRNLPDFMAPDKMPSMSAYIRTAQRMDGRRSEILQHVETTAKRWMRYTTKNKDSGRILGELMHAATLAGVDPAIDYKPQFKKADTDAKKSIETQRREQYALLRRFWDKLDAEGKALYTEVRDTYSRHRDQIMKALEGRIESTQAAGETKKALLAQLREKFEQGRVMGPYFPLARFGKHWAVAKDKGGEPVSFSKFEKPSEQRQWMAEMRKQGFTVDGGESMTDMAMLKRIDPSFVANVTTLLTEADPKLADEVWQMYLRAMPEMSMRKHFIHRKGRLGFTGDAIRSFGFNMFHGAHQLAKLENMSALEGYLNQMKEEARALEKSGDKEAKWAAPLVKEFDKRHEWALNPKASSFATALTSLGFAWYLGATPAAALVNLTQTVIVGFPTLAAKFNWLGAGSELAKAAAQYAGSRGDYGNRLRGEERAAWDEARLAGLFDKTNAHTLAGVADEGVDYTSKRTQAMSIISWLFHKAEEMNRQVTFMAAYRLARRSGQTHETSIHTAEDLTWDSHFDYSNVNRARVLQSDTAKVLLLFRQYSANMTYRLARDFNDSFRGAKPEIKKAARKRFAGIIGMTSLFAGASGMPLFWLAEAIINAVMGDEDDPYDFDKDFRAELAEQYGADVAEAIFKGPVDTLSDITISNRVGLNNLWLRETPENLHGSDLFMHYLGEAAGPLPQLGKRALEAALLSDQGYDDRAIEKVLPKAAGDVLKALRFARDGVQNMRGDELLPAKEFTSLDAFYQAIGFTPARVTMQYEQNRAIKAAEKHLLDRRALLMDRLFLSARNEDRVGISEAVARIEIFNKKNPSIAIGVGNIIRSARTRARYSNEAVEGVRVDPGLWYLHKKKKITPDKEPDTED